MSPRLFLPLALLAGGGALPGCTGDSLPPAAVTQDVTVENLRLVREGDGSRTVRGVVVNESGAERSVQVEIALYDGANQRIGEVQVPVEHVAAGTQQGFSRTLDREAAGARVSRLLVF
jgi:hypothetical protein